MKVLALRGATTVDENTKTEVDAKTQALVAEMLERNTIGHDDLVSIIFTATDDITAEFLGARQAVGVAVEPDHFVVETGEREPDRATDEARPDDSDTHGYSGRSSRSLRVPSR